MKVKCLIEVYKCMMQDLLARYGVKVISIHAYFLSIFFKIGGLRRQQLSLLMFAHRISPSLFLAKAVKKELPVLTKHFSSLVTRDVQLKEACGRSIILAVPKYNQDQLVSKGILLITFTRTFSFYFHNIDIPSLMREYTIVLEPSWAGYCDPDILFWGIYNEPVIVESTERRDRELLTELGTNLVPVSFGASDWVDYRIFHPIDAEIKYDVVYVANLTSIKRIHAYLCAIKEATNLEPDFKAALVTAQWGGRRNMLENLLNYYGLYNKVDCYQDLSQAEVNKIFNSSRVSVLLSLKEGSNRTLFESLFANTPVITLKENIGVNKDYINESTGLLIDESDLAKSMLHFRNLKQPLEPREWVMCNISPEVTTQKLSSAINEVSKLVINNRDVAVKVNAPEVAYLDKSQASKMPEVYAVLSKYLKK